MSVERDYKLSISGTIKEYEKAISGVPGVTEKEARKASLALHRELIKGQRLASAAAKKAASEAGSAWGKSGKSAADAAGGFGRAKGALDLFGTSAGPVAQGLNDIGDAMEGAAAVGSALPGLLNPVGAGVAVVGAAVAAGVVVWKLSNKEQETAARRAKDAKEAYEALKPVLDGIAEAETRIAVATGRMSEEQAVELRTRRGALDQLRQVTKANADRQAELREEATSTTVAFIDQYRAVATALGPMGAMQLRLSGLARGSEEVNADLGAQVDLFAGAAAVTERFTGTTITATRAEEKAATAKKGHKKALDDATEALAAYNQMQQESAAGAAAAAASFASLGTSSDEKRAAALKEQVKQRERLTLLQGGKSEEKRAEIEHAIAIRGANDALREQVASIDAIRMARLALAQTTAAQETAEADFRAAKVEAERATQAEIAAIQSEYHEKQIVRTQAANEANASAYGQMFGSIADSAYEFSSQMAKRDKEAAIVAFRVAQGAALAQAGINTALMISNALKDFPIPLNAAMAVAAGLAGGLQVAAIAAQAPPTAHAGESRVRAKQPGPQEVDRRLRVDEAVLTGQGADAIGRGRIDRANDGLDPFAGMGGMSGVSVYGHRADARFMQDRIALTGPLRSALTAGSSSTIGMRTRKAS